MASSGLTYSPLRYSLYVPTHGSEPHNKKVPHLPNIGRFKDPLCLQRNGLARSTWRYKQHHTLVKGAMDASFGDLTNGSNAIFPRINVKDPYKRLGISKEASEEEIQAARNFLIQTYGGDKNSVDAIESAHDKIIMQKFYERKNPKINIKKKVREVTQSRYVQAVTTRFKTPATSFIIKTSIAFIVLGVLTVLFPTEEGPTLQVAISLIVTTYFIFDRLKSKLRALLYGVGTFALSWLIGTFLMVSVMPPILKGPRSLEVTTSLNFVDLAGSESASQSLSAGTRLKEGCHINRSLLTLGTVIQKLRKGRNGYIPYRDSKLTRIFQTSLGENARTAIICTMIPA